MVSADRDLLTDEVAKLRTEYQAVAGDWESGVIAYTAARNKTKILILRGVTDVVNSKQGEDYDNIDVFVQRT